MCRAEWLRALCVASFLNIFILKRYIFLCVAPLSVFFCLYLKLQKGGVQDFSPGGAVNGGS